MAALAAVHTATITHNSLRQRCGVVRPTPSSNASSWALAPSAMRSSKICRAIWRSSGKFNRHRYLPKRPESCVRRTASKKRSSTAALLPLQAPSSYGLVLFEAFDFPMILGKEPLEILLLIWLVKLAGLRIQGEYWLLVCIPRFAGTSIPTAPSTGAARVIRR